MMQNHPINCPVCGKWTGLTEEGIMHLYLTSDIKCPYCGKVIVSNPNPIW